MKDIQEGDVFYRSLEITPQLMDIFAKLSGDYGLLHVDNEYAKSKGFKGRFSYGNILGLMVSGLVGNELPSERVIEISEQLNFKELVYEGDIIKLSAVVAYKSDATGVFELKLDFTNNLGVKVANGKLQVKFV